VTVSSIVDARFGQRYRDLGREPLLKEAILLFRYLRQEVRNLEHKPSMAELLNWLNYLRYLKTEHLDKNNAQVISSIKTILLKKKSDQTESQVAEWLDKALKS